MLLIYLFRRKKATLLGNVGVENVDKLELYNIFKSI